MQDFVSFIVLGLVQGLTEFLPVSSTGHLILVRDLFGFATEHGLAIDAVLQLATGLAVVVYFYKDILNLVLLRQKQLLIALVAATVPAIVVGLLAEDAMETIFRNTELVAYALLAGSFVMLAAEWQGKSIAKRVPKAPDGQVSLTKALGIGLFQCLALIPGMSRSGMTIAGGLFLGLTREGAARFGFLLSVPIILGSGLKKLLELGFDGTLAAVGPALFGGSVVAFVSGLVAIHALLLFVRTQPLYAFIAYRVALAGVILFLV